MVYNTVTLKLDITLPQDHILTADQASKMSWSFQGKGTTGILSSGELQFQTLQPVVSLVTPEQSARLQLSLWIYFCQKDDLACILDRRTINVDDPLTQAKGSELVIPVVVTV